MDNKLYLSSTEMKRLLSISDCHLMHERESGNLKFKKQGNRFLYETDPLTLLSKHPLANKVINWYQQKHDICINNFPVEKESIEAIASLLVDILIPIQKKFGDLEITYGFVSKELNTYIQKNSRSGTSPSIDQHSSHEINSNKVTICNRGGAACDFYVSSHKHEMHYIVGFIVANLDFDKIYYYGKDRPIHLSVSKNMQKHLQIMNISENGRRVPGKKAYGDAAISLAQEII